VRWFQQRPAELLYLSVLTLGEIRKGVELRPPDARRVALQEWLGTELPRFFRGRILGIDAATAERWGRVTALAGRPVPTVDGLLAATALQHDLVLVTRNVRDFAGLGVRLLNPWDAQPTI
jgi:toxin FitB